MDMQPLAKSPIQPERRYTQRRKYFGKIEIEWGSATLIGTVRDIGPQGMFIELSPPLWLGATFFARLAIQPVLLLDCRVNRVEPGTGMGISFAFPEESGRAQLEMLLAALPQV